MVIQATGVSTGADGSLWFLQEEPGFANFIKTIDFMYKRNSQKLETKDIARKIWGMH